MKEKNELEEVVSSSRKIKDRRCSHLLLLLPRLCISWCEVWVCERLREITVSFWRRGGFESESWEGIRGGSFKASDFSAHVRRGAGYLSSPLSSTDVCATEQS